MQEATQKSTGPNQAEATTEFREIQDRYKLAQKTFQSLLKIGPRPDRRTVLETACSSTAEFAAFPIKQAEKAFFRHINEHTGIPYILRENVSQPWHKPFLLIQIQLHGGPLPNKLTHAARKELLSERGQMFFILDRVLRCLVDILGLRRDGRGVIAALDVLRSIKAGVWDGNENELLQVEGIGAVKMDKLANAGIKTIRQLAGLQCYHIERLLSRNPPFGQEMVCKLKGFPLLRINIDILGPFKEGQDQLGAGKSKLNTLPTTTGTLWMTRIVLGYENEEVPQWKKKSLWTTFVIEGEDGRLVWFWRGSVKKLENEQTMIVCLAVEKGEKLGVVFAGETVVGTTIRESLQID
ncbi:unnamed protein product [Clonostachys rosea f. rosea IK726]|jgi:ATP-dependent DNA helicase HFM1/MER3|uniref:SEC63 domain-containing protein n=2 Tax=Bionectria ochroleuca TaxID=29856 RepID=A0A0B7KBG7_BIOOC|nr:unnamed protein product [Clonostachys rosea f. rosea IK726]